MALDLDKFIRASEFSFELVSPGVVRCKSLTDDLMREARKRLKTPDFDSKKLVRWLLGEMAKQPRVRDFKETDPIEGESLTVDQLASVAESELESFSEQVLKKNIYLTRTRESDELKRVDGQSACDFLAHAIVHRGNEEKTQLDRMIQSVNKPLFTESTLDSIKRSLTASNQLERLIKTYSGKSALDSIRESVTASNQTESLVRKYAGDATLAERVLSQPRQEPQMVTVAPIHFPKNPIHETNQILENLTTQIEDIRPMVGQVAEVIRSMNDTALRMQADYITNASAANAQTKRAMYVAVLSLIVSSWFSYQSYVDGKANAAESKNQSAASEKLLNDLMTAQRNDRVALTKALAELKQPLPVGKK